MAKSKKTQLLTLSLIATLISFIPFLSTSFRSTYLYFIINVLIVVLGLEAGFLSSSPNKKSTPSNNTKLQNSTTNARHVKVHVEEDNDMSKEKTGVENSSPDNKIVVCANEVKKMIKKCPSTPSMFFIGGNESEVEVQEKVQEDNEDQGVYEEEELFEKAETFIVNFYKQLKMQREESWNKIHGFEENGVVVG